VTVYGLDEYGRFRVQSAPARTFSVSDGDWRGAQIIAYPDAETVTIKLHLEASFIGTRTIARSLLPADMVGAILGAPCKVRVTGSGKDDYVITEVISSRFPPGAEPPDQVAAVGRGEFWPGIASVSEWINGQARRIG
jgi:hypothetical protein